MNARPFSPRGILGLYTADFLAPLDTFLMTTSRRQAQGDLEAVIDEPLKRGEGANHGNSHG